MLTNLNNVDTACISNRGTDIEIQTYRKLPEITTRVNTSFRIKSKLQAHSTVNQVLQGTRWHINDRTFFSLRNVINRCIATIIQQILN